MIALLPPLNLGVPRGLEEEEEVEEEEEEEE